MEMSLARALLELKTLDKRIEKAISEHRVYDLKQKKMGNKALISHLTLDDFEKEAMASSKSISDLIHYRRTLKSAVSFTNATTMVKFMGQEMSICDVIDYKKISDYNKTLLNKLKEQRAACERQVEFNRSHLDNQIQQMLLQNYGKDKKANADDYEAISKPLIEANETLLVDPLKSFHTINRLTKEIDEFEKEVDITLSEINARTMIKL